MNEPMHTAELHTILDECLDAVLRGGLSVDDCLARYPQHAADLRPALEIALLTAHLRQPRMSAGGVDALENRLRGDMLRRPRRAPAASALHRLGRLAAMVAIVMLALLGTTGGAVAASENAVPGETLYPVKRAWENIVLALSPLTGSPDEIWLWIAQRRLWEAETLAQRGQLTTTALVDLLDAMEQAASLAAPEQQPALRAYLDEVRAGLGIIAPPPGAEAVYAEVMAGAAPPALPDSVPATAATDTPTATAALILSATATATFTPSPTTAHTEPPPASPTSRVPATATSTPVPPTFTPSPVPPTLTASPSATASATWTPLPLPGGPLPTFTPRPSLTAQPQPPTSTIGPTPEPLATERLRETQAAIYMTQTAQAQPNGAPAAATEEP